MNEIIRDTNTVLMNQVLELVKKGGCYDEAESIMDYFLAETYNVRTLTNYRFDFLTRLNFGGSEGIYLDCYIEGTFSEGKNDNKVERLSCGTFKTLEESLEAMKIMGKLADLTYFASKYVNREIDRYIPLKELEASGASNDRRQVYKCMI